ncbi:MAG: filamentous hemagglutinin N-terminal domain-containing protein, partial [Candidatus Parabeggiatoa sp.]|nr:filamentous hemagglutinin N-terminal domain-containing protein [Candidatus Parabeggiatoa sp.]
MRADLGQQHGGNLFHSFQEFNLSSPESATFSGPNNVSNVISRVTGGNPSNIDGLIRSTMPNADMYFMNPYGMMFGPHARLDVQGSFHASTADYLRFGDGGRFDARNPSDSLLTIAPIESFGFLTDSAAAIQITDSHLEVQPTQTLSLTGGDINLTNTEPTTYDEASHHIFTNQLLAPSGLIIIDAQGTLNLTHFGIDTSGLFGGQISIRGKKLEMNDSRISSHTFGALDGQSIDIRTDNLLMRDSDIIADTYGTGRGNNLHLQVTENLTATREDRPLSIEFGIGVRGTSHISTLTAGPSRSGDISIQAGNIDLNQAAEIRTRTISSGKAGDISVQVTDMFKAKGVLQLASGTSLVSGGAHIMGVASGDNGNIDITARHIQFAEGAQITSMVLGSGHGGDITVNADTVHLKDVSPTGLSASITNVTGGSGQAGRSEVNANQITLEDGGSIVTTTMSIGDANELVVKVADTLIITGVAKHPFQSAYLPLIYFPSNINSASVNPVAESGQASNVTVEAKQIILENGGIISSLTYGGGHGGNAKIIADTLRISGSQEIGPFFFRSGINNSSTNPAPYAGPAGNIEVTARHLSIGNGG